METVYGDALVCGTGAGPVMATDVPLSFWGGLNPETGEIVDRYHPLCGKNVSGCVLVMPTGRGSCSSSGVLLEAMFKGHAPAAILLRKVDEVVALGPIVAEEMFGLCLPVVVLTAADYARAMSAKAARVHSDGRVDLDCAVDE